MNDWTKTGLAIAFAAASWLSMAFGGEDTTGTVIHGGMMEGAGMGEIGWMFLPSLLLGILGVALVAAILKKK